MNPNGSPDLGAFALCFDPPEWIHENPSGTNARETVWSKIGPDGVSIVAARGGFIVFEFEKSQSYSGGSTPAYTIEYNKSVPKAVFCSQGMRVNIAYRRFTYMNAFLCAVYSSIATVQKRASQLQEPIDPINYFLAQINDVNWEILRITQVVSRPAPASRPIIALDTLNNAVDILDKFRSKIGGSAYDILSLIYQASYHYKKHQFSTAHLIAWSTIEALLNNEWKRLQDAKNKDNGGSTKFSRERKDLLNGRDYTASIISQMLSLFGIVDDDTLKRLDEARKKRNAFMHNLEQIDADSANKAIVLATDMISKVIDSKVTSSLSYGAWGI